MSGFLDHRRTRESTMELTGETDQHLGHRYRCKLCGRYYWSAWGWDRRHAEKHRVEASRSIKSC